MDDAKMFLHDAKIGYFNTCKNPPFRGGFCSLNIALKTAKTIFASLKASLT